MIAVAVSTDRPVGVDIQELMPGLDLVRLSARFFPPDEARYVAAGSGSTRADRFALLWARKEAVVKAVGGRLWANLPTAVRGRDVVSWPSRRPVPGRRRDRACGLSGRGGAGRRRTVRAGGRRRADRHGTSHGQLAAAAAASTRRPPGATR